MKNSIQLMGRKIFGWRQRRVKAETLHEPMIASNHEAVVSLTSKGFVVNDTDVSHCYPDVAQRLITGLSLKRGEHTSATTINVFEASEIGLITPFYLPIDLRRGWLFKNHTYSTVFDQSWPGLEIDGATYRYEPASAVRIRRKVIVVGGFLIPNYYHWMMNWLARLAILQSLRPDLFLDETIGILIDQRAYQTPIMDFLLSIGIGADRLVWSSGQDVFLDNAILVSLGNNDATCPYVVSAMRKLFDPSGSTQDSGRRLWISRQPLGPNRRRVANMEQISPILDLHGFENVTLESMPIASQISLFKSAEAVVGVHGSGLTNIMFCPQDCRVVAIESDLNLKLGTSKFYSTLAEACSLRYTPVKVKRASLPAGSARSFPVAHNQDYVVEPAALDTVLRDILTPRG